MVVRRIAIYIARRFRRIGKKPLAIGQRPLISNLDNYNRKVHHKQLFSENFNLSLTSQNVTV